MKDLINRLNRAIDVEYDSKNEEVDHLLKMSVEDRVVKGETIGNLRAEFELLDFQVQNSPKKVFKNVRVFCEDNISKFREGSPVILHGHNHRFKCNVIEDRGREMLLAIDWNLGAISPIFQSSSGWQLDNAKVDIRHIVKKSTIILNNNLAKHNYISGIFSGAILPKFSELRAQEAEKIVRETNLNDIQKEAFVYAYSAENYYLIQGPPGSGKTWLLGHLAGAFAKEGKKVLITAFTHAAINNALQKTAEVAGHPHIIKVGKKYQNDKLQDNKNGVKSVVDFTTTGYRNDSGGIIVGATCYSPHTRKLEFMDWDVIIIDEAAQLSIPLAVAAMVKGKKFIFIGDHKQLPPIIPETQKDPEFSRSIFELLFQHAPGIMLDVTYRMNRAINRFPSHAFYEGRLQPHPKNADWMLNVENDFAKHQPILDPRKPEVLYCHYHQSFSTRSEYEAVLVGELTAELLRVGVPISEIAIITPFRAQVRQIKNVLATLELDEDIVAAVFVDTIERMQGQERDVIIFSMATSNPVKAQQRAKFFFDPNRLNVALTRARKKRIVIANKELFDSTSEDPGIQTLIDYFTAFYEDAYKVEESVVGEDLF